MYTCCRDGNKKGHNGPNKSGKARKSKYTCKLEDYCVARIIRTQHLNDGRVKVKYISTHTYIATELALHHLALVGPIEPAHQLGIHISPLGDIPIKHKDTQWRLIMNLSLPHGHSVNDGIQKEHSVSIILQ